MFGQILDFFERRSERAKSWSSVAAQKGGEYRPPRGPFYQRTKPSLQAEIMNVMVQVTLRVQSRDAIFTLVRAPWLLGAGPSIEIVRTSMLRRMGRALGLQDAPTGDPRFDEAFIVTTNTPMLVPHVLGARPRRSLCALSPMRVDCSAAQVVLTHAGVITDPPRLSLTMDAVAEIASHGTAQVAVLSQLPGRFTPPMGPPASRIVPRAELELGGTRVRVMAISYPRGVYYALRAELRRNVPDLVLQFVDGVPDPTPPEGLFDPETFGTLVALGNLTLRTNQRVAQLEVSGHLDGEALTRAARWLGSFVEGRRQGAFR